MTKKFFSLTLLSAMAAALSSTVSAQIAVAPNAAGQANAAGQVTTKTLGEVVDMKYFGIVTKFDEKKGALIKIISVQKNKSGQSGDPTYVDQIAYLPPARIEMMKEKVVKIGDYLEFDLMTPQKYPDPYFPTQDKDGNVTLGVGYQMVLSGPIIIHTPPAGMGQNFMPKGIAAP